MLWLASGVKAMHIGYYEIDDVLDEHPTVNFDCFTEDEFKNFLVKHY